MPPQVTMRQNPKAPKGRAPGTPWRKGSKYPLFEIFRTEYIALTSEYSKPYLRRISFGAIGVPDHLVDTMQAATSWTIECLFGPDFLKEWKTDHPRAK